MEEVVGQGVCGDVAEVDRQRVGEDSRSVTGSKTQSEGRTPAGKRSTLFRRDLVDSVDRGSMERVAASIRQLRDLLATASGVGRKWRPVGDVALFAFGPE